MSGVKGKPKAASCPWCCGNGYTMNLASPLTTEAGHIMHYDRKPCWRCNESGVILYRPLEDGDVKDESK